MYEGTEKQTGEKCALKIIDKKVLDKESLELIAYKLLNLGMKAALCQCFLIL